MYLRSNICVERNWKHGREEGRRHVEAEARQILDDLKCIVTGFESQIHFRICQTSLSIFNTILFSRGDYGLKWIKLILISEDFQKALISVMWVLINKCDSEFSPLLLFSS